MIKKWEPVVNTLGFNYDPIRKYLCVVCETLSISCNDIQLPDIVFSLLLKEIKKEYDNYMLNNKNLRPTIIRKYFNIATGKEGFELDNGFLVEGGLVINDTNDIVNSSLKNKLHDIVKDVVNPALHLRNKKMKRIQLKRILTIN